MENKKSKENNQDQTQKLKVNFEEVMENGGIEIFFSGKNVAQQIIKKVKPHILQEISELSIGNEKQRTKNLIIEGDNLKTMATLYQYHGKVDLILTDPPYNTGSKDFRYNDKWDEDPNDEELGDYVNSDDNSCHTKWMKFMLPRLQMMKKMLKPNGVLAICIDERELFRLGMMLNEIFGEKNRLAIINWQKAYAPKSTKKKKNKDNSESRKVLSSATEYVLVYSKRIEDTYVGKLKQTEKQKSRFTNKDNDPKGLWRSTTSLVSHFKVKNPSKIGMYAIQNPFSGELYYPFKENRWRFVKSSMKPLLEEWDLEYEEKNLNDNCVSGLILKGFDLNNLKNPEKDPIFQQAKEKVQKRYQKGLNGKQPWPRLIYLKKGFGKIQFKLYFSEVQEGVSPLTWWDYEDCENLLELGSMSWHHQVSGHNQRGTKELKNRVGSENNFIGIKPLELFKRIVQLWCPPNGLTLDPFAGSGTTGEVILQLNKEEKINNDQERQFILIEQGNPNNKDNYCQTLLQKRLQAVITGQWADNKKHETLEGGFRFLSLGKKINSEILLKMNREEIINLIVASNLDSFQKNLVGLELIKKNNYCYLIAKNSNQEGIYLIWNEIEKNNNFNEEIYNQCIKESYEAGLKNIYHVYAKLCLCQIEGVIFYQIPDNILLDFGFEIGKEF